MFQFSFSFYIRTKIFRWAQLLSFLILTLPEYLFSIIEALITGTMILNVFKHELPIEENSKGKAFIVGILSSSFLFIKGVSEKTYDFNRRMNHTSDAHYYALLIDFQYTV